MCIEKQGARSHPYIPHDIKGLKLNADQASQDVDLITELNVINLSQYSPLFKRGVGGDFLNHLENSPKSA